MFKKYWNGDVKLWIAFWLINAPFNLITKRLFSCQFSSNRYLEIHGKAKECLFTVPVFWDLVIRSAIIILAIYIIIGLWRSATKYNIQNPKKKFWGILVKIVLIAGLIANGVALFAM